MRALAWAMLLLALSGPVARGQPLEKLRLVVTHAAPPLVPNSVLDLADTLGFYRREGLAVEFVRVAHTPLAVVALKNGYGDLAHISVSALAQLVAQNRMRLKAVLAPDTSIPFLIAARRDIGSVSDLHGRSLGVGGVGSVDHSLTRSVLTALGADADQVRMVAIGEPRLRAQALAAGNIDATAISLGAWLRLRANPNLHVLVDPRAYFAAAPGIDKVIAGEDTVLQTKAEAVRRFVRAIVKASRAFAADPVRWADAMAAARPDVPRPELDELARAYAGNWLLDGGLDRGLIARSLERLYRDPDFKDLRRLGPEDLIEETLLREALDSAEGRAR
jgi:NitT/TauT family transport system substrate-binding protein